MERGDFFDLMAPVYDGNFTHTVTGEAQRKIVHRYLKRIHVSGKEVLEINCGTGEDALLLASLGYHVLATDASEEMIAEACRKSRTLPASTHLEFRKLAFSELPGLSGAPPVDLLFSNFSGLNCVAPGELRGLSAAFHGLLKPGGKAVVIIFGKKCLWERLFLRIRQNRRESARRNTTAPVTVMYRDSSVQVWYYSVTEFRDLLGPGFALVNSKAIGLLLPPSYLDPFFRRQKWLIRLLAIAERILGGFRIFSDYGDHCLVEFRRI